MAADALVHASLSIRVDALSAFFLLVISGLSFAAAWFAVGYTRTMTHVGRLLPAAAAVRLRHGRASSCSTTSSSSSCPWEFMALSSYLLVVFHREKAESLAAGFRYFFVTHAGTLAAVLRRGAAGRCGRQVVRLRGPGRARCPRCSPAQPALAHGGLLLILLGFLVKAGCFPFGMWWLPAAHPAAPSPVSALLSGAMIKLGLYGILRVFFEILPGRPLVASAGG